VWGRSARKLRWAGNAVQQPVVVLEGNVVAVKWWWGANVRRGW